MTHRSLSHLSDCELLSRTRELTRKERATTLAVLLHLAEVERRRLHLSLGYSSLFDYCTGHLGYSNSAAGRRIQTARCLRRHPGLHELLAKNEVNLTTVSLIAPLLKDGNNPGLIQSIRKKSQREVEAIVAKCRPAVAYRDRVKPVCVPVSGTASRPTSGACETIHDSRSGSNTATGQPQDSSESMATTRVQNKTRQTPSHARQPKIEHKLLIQFLTSPAFMKKYSEVRSLLSNKLPNASFESVFEALLDEFLGRHSPKKKRERRERRRKNSQGTRTKRSGAAKDNGSRHIPAAIRDEVFIRDNGRCTYVGSTGKRCTATDHLEIDHIKPVARGGRNTAANLRLLCSRHNKLEAERTLGSGIMRQFRRREQSLRRGEAGPSSYMPSY